MHYSPVRRSTPPSKLGSFPLDLHVLSLPPAFNLSHDQTLQFTIIVILTPPPPEGIGEKRINLGSRFKRSQKDPMTEAMKSLTSRLP